MAKMSRTGRVVGNLFQVTYSKRQVNHLPTALAITVISLVENSVRTSVMTNAEFDVNFQCIKSNESVSATVDTPVIALITSLSTHAPVRKQ